MLPWHLPVQPVHIYIFKSAQPSSNNLGSNLLSIVCHQNPPLRGWWCHHSHQLNSKTIKIFGKIFFIFFFNKQVAAEENEIIFHSGIVSGKNNRSEQSPKQPVSEEKISDLVSQMNFSYRRK